MNHGFRITIKICQNFTIVFSQRSNGVKMVKLVSCNKSNYLM